METDASLKMYVIAWLVIAVLICRTFLRRDLPTTGLSLVYIFSLSLFHWFGALIHTFPWFTSSTSHLVKLGFIQCIYGLIAFGFGSVVITPFLIKCFRFPWLKGKSYVPEANLPKIYIIIGLVFYIGLNPILGGIFSIRTLGYSGWYLLVVGICLHCWELWRRKKRVALIRWLVFSGLLPLFTMVRMGFLGMGIIMLLVIFIFVSTFYRPRWGIVLGALLSFYLGLSLFVNYMDYREALRYDITAGAPMSSRFNILSEMIDNFEFINLYNEIHLYRIDMRLNQGYLIGVAIEHLSAGKEKYAKGKTLWQCIPAVIPRLLWPEKKLRFGGAGLITKYTGMAFAEYTSVAMGPVMEFYINFATIGVVIGFIILGIIISFIDIAAGYRLAQGDWKNFALLFASGLCFLEASYMFHIAMNVTSILVFCVLVNKFILARFSEKKLLR